MSERLLRLAQRIRDECCELARLVTRAQDGWHRAQQSADDLYVDSVRNVYAFRFDQVKVRTLVQGAPVVSSRVRAELLAFADFLDQQALANGESG